jgi:hypothetical protein
MIPEALRPTSIEPFQISPSTVVGVPKTLPTFATWRGPSIPNTYGGKVVLEFAGEPLFAELVILRHFQREGWQGAWIDTYRRRTLSGIDQVSEIPPGPRARLTAISGHAGSSSGCFDVYVWRGDTFMFAEAKRLGAIVFGRAKFAGFAQRSRWVFRSRRFSSSSGQLRRMRFAVRIEFLDAEGPR